MAVERAHMPDSRADLAVYDPAELRVRLVVEIKMSDVDDLGAASENLRAMMLRANCHSGLLVTPVHIYVYGDTFRTSTPDAVEMIEPPLSTQDLLRPFAPRQGLDSEAALTSSVAAWLEAFSKDWSSHLPSDPKAAGALLPGVVGAVAGGEIRRDVYV